MKNLRVNLNKNTDLSYDIIIKRGILDNIGSYLGRGRFFIITNEKLAKIYKKFLYNFLDNYIIIIKDGEKYKNAKTIQYILDELLKRKIERQDCIIAFGGGVIGDMAGFCASTILRGVGFIQIPTTLLAQVDSSVGGKTGYNTKHGKNLIGAFYQPKKVLIDPNTLDTLSARDFKSGMGEVVKYAFIENSINCSEKFNLLETLTRDSNIDSIIYACVALKAAVVEQDEKEKGLRTILNLGHTYAHAIEKITNYKYSHGQAVAIGIKMALKTSLLRGLIEKDYYDLGVNLMKKLDLESEAKKFNPEKIIEIMKSDKKVKDSKINLILPLTSGQSALFDDTDELLIRDSLL